MAVALILLVRFQWYPAFVLAVGAANSVATTGTLTLGDSTGNTGTFDLSSYSQTIGGLKVKELVTIDGFQYKLEDGGWMLIRFSGTEPILRVYCETMHGDKVDAILQDGLKVAGIK